MLCVVFGQPAFPEDDGDLAVRGTVHGYMFTKASEAEAKQ